MVETRERGGKRNINISQIGQGTIPSRFEGLEINVFLQRTG
jgi:hypothetical protein